MNEAQIKQNVYQPILTNDYNFPVREVPLYAQWDVETGDSTNINGMEIMKTNTIIKPVAMKGIVRADTNKVIATVSDKYTLVPHSNVIDAAERALAGRGGFERKVFTTHDGARLYGEYRMKDLQSDVSGDKMEAMIIVRNSYDASSSVSIAVQGLRLICLNGMMGMGSMFSFGKKHIGEITFNDDLREDIGIALNRYNDNLIPFWKNLSEKRLSMDYGVDIIKNASEEKIMPKKYEEEVIDKWETEAGQRNAWILLNCFTFVFTHIIKRKSYENYLNLNKKVSEYIGRRFTH